MLGSFDKNDVSKIVSKVIAETGYEPNQFTPAEVVEKIVTDSIFETITSRAYLDHITKHIQRNAL